MKAVVVAVVVLDVEVVVVVLSVVEVVDVVVLVLVVVLLSVVVLVETVVEVDVRVVPCKKGKHRPNGIPDKVQAWQTCATTKW